MPAFSRKKVKQLAREVVAEHPDGHNGFDLLYFYSSHNPCCFVGHILAKTSIDIDFLLGDLNTEVVSSEEITDWLLEQGFTHKAVLWLSEVQKKADRASAPLWRDLVGADDE